jgi:hypothetical protein
MLDTSSCKKGEAGEQQPGTKSTRNEGWTSSKLEKKFRDQYNFAVPFARAITDVTGTSHQGRRNGGTPVGYSGRAVLTRVQCDMTP